MHSQRGFFGGIYSERRHGDGELSEDAADEFSSSFPFRFLFAFMNSINFVIVFTFAMN